jgi:hypothetical protein
MDNINLIDSFSELKEIKNIDRTTMSKVRCVQGSYS